MVIAAMVIGVFTLSAIGNPASGATTYKAVADAFVDQHSANRNFGSRARLRADSAPVVRSHLRFNVVTGAPVTSAALEVYAFTAHAGFEVRSGTSAWAEKTITYQNAPAPGSAVVKSGRVRANTWVAVDVTPLLNGSEAVELVLTTGGTEMDFGSRESAKPPRLRVATTATTTTVPSSGDPVLVGAGDIAQCSSNGDEETAALLDRTPGTVFTVGDNVYPDGSAANFTNCYQGSWGRHKARTRPAPGNHEYRQPGAGPYFQYFGANAGQPGKGWYSYDSGSWHVVVLNSNCNVVGCDRDSAQGQWLRADLAAHPNVCTAAIYHHPRFSSGDHGGDANVQTLWGPLDDHGVDVVINGHDHSYERFAPMDGAGRADSAGIRQFVVGTGGAQGSTFGGAQPNSELRKSGSNGLLKLTLHKGSYDWEFLATAGDSFRDSGRGTCH
jgi:hypothetical protein